MPYTDPKRTIELLDELERLGLTDNAFARLHHFWQHPEENPRRHTTIHQHRRYCAMDMADHFQAGRNNARVQHRLEIVSACYVAYHPGDPSVFPQLAAAAVDLIPFLPLSRS